MTGVETILIINATVIIVNTMVLIVNSNIALKEMKSNAQRY